MPKNPHNGVIHLHDLTEYTGTFSWNPDILRYSIELDIPGYSSYDPATWPRISKDTISRSIGRPYDGSVALPGGVAAYNGDVMSLFLDKVAKGWPFKASISAQNQSNPNSTVRWGFRDFPFVFAQDGGRKKPTRWCNLPLTVRDMYVQLLRPSQSALMDNVRRSLGAQQVPSGYRPLANPLPPRPGPPSHGSLSQEPDVKEVQHEETDSSSAKPPKSSEEAYRELLGMLEDQNIDTKEPRETGSFVAQETSPADTSPADTPQTDEGESVSNAAFFQCENAVKQLTDLARLEFHALRAELDEKVRGFDDKMRMMEERANAAEEKGRELEKHMELNQRVIYDLNARIVVANARVLSACDDARVANMERKKSDRRAADLEEQLGLKDSELIATKEKSKQADERLMTLWAAMEKSKSSILKRRTEASEPPSLKGADATRDTKGARKDKQAYVESGDDSNETLKLDAPGVGNHSRDSILDVSTVSDRSASLTVVKSDCHILQVIPK